MNGDLIFSGEQIPLAIETRHFGSTKLQKFVIVICPHLSVYGPFDKVFQFSSQHNKWKRNPTADFYILGELYGAMNNMQLCQFFCNVLAFVSDAKYATDETMVSMKASYGFF